MCVLSYRFLGILLVIFCMQDIYAQEDKKNSALDSVRTTIKVRKSSKRVLAPGMKDSTYLANARIYNNLGVALKDPSKVYKFQLAYLDDLRAIPKELFELTNIQVLEIRFLPRLSDIPPEIKKLKNLQKLYIDMLDFSYETDMLSDVQGERKKTNPRPSSNS